MKILILGAGGQVGTDLRPLLLARGATLHCFDIKDAPAGLQDGVAWSQGDITDKAAVEGLVGDVQPDVIYHLAAMLSATGELNPQAAYRVNMEGTYNVLECARERNVSQVMFASTIAVFGPGLESPVPDDVPLLPATMYGVTKVAGELLGTYYHRKYGVDFRGVRFPGLINAGIPGGGTTDYALYMFVDGIQKGAYECFVGPESTVPMMYMADGLRAMVELSEAPRSSLTRCIYNIGAVSPTAAEFADAVRARVPGVKLTFKADPKRQAILDSWPAAVDDTCARSDWGWKHQFDLDAMSDDLVEKIRAM
ncbi:MAG: NAD-dependent epimerase/dehydratase family protein [Planctomycetota bacterium]